ncbi:MAG: CusA/CzcA family heavy metal efflux RND transporter, partial [Methylococcales bacterium]|nr:CusA/CzcA family heavy metal efflux RND transporter [Methylococcales bacterium]
MLEKLLKFSIQQRSAIVLMMFIIIALGLWNFTKLPIDAVPDITNVQVMINTEAAGYTPFEVEQRVSYPIETALSGIPNLDYTRSISRYGLSQVTAIFSDDTDIYFARQLVSERLNSMKSELPRNIEPKLGPIATGLGEIFMFTVDALPGAINENGQQLTPMDLRTYHDWVIRPQLMRVSGVAEVNPIGGFEQEILIGFDPEKLLSFGLTQADLIHAIENNNENKGAGFIEHNGAQWLLRIPGQVQALEELANIAIRTSNGSSIRVKDVASVSLGKSLRTGAATQNGREVVMSTVFMLIGENSRNVAKAVGDK